MSQEILDTNFTKLSHGDYILMLYTLADKLEGHLAFQDLPEHVPGPPRFRDYAEQLTKAVEAAKYGDKHKGAERDELRARSQQDITFAAQHAVMVSVHRNDPSMLANIGLEQKQRTYTRTPTIGIPGMPSKLTVKNGSAPGTVIASVNREPGAGSIEVQYTEADPAIEAFWKSAGMFYQCRMEVKGLESVKRYHFKVRYHGSSGAGPWSAIVNLVVI